METSRGYFNPRHSIIGRKNDQKSKNKWISTKFADSVYSDTLVQIVSRTLLRNGCFQELLWFVAKYSEV